MAVMTTDLTGATVPTEPMKALPPEDKAEPRRYRPAPPDHGSGRWFRACAGIKEDVLDWVPSDRAKYAGLGIIVLNTGCLAAFAMFTALTKIVTAPAIALVPVALVWGWMIFSIDRWLITSTHGMRGASRALVFIPRLVLAVLIAFTIAEPLTLRIFQNSLDTQVEITRTTQLENYESSLQTCNPLNGQPDSAAACTGFRLNTPGSPSGEQSQLAEAKKQVVQLQPAVASAQANYQKDLTTEEDEAAGTAGAGLSGHGGEGPLYKSDHAAAMAAEDSLAAKQAQLTAAENTVAILSPQVGSAEEKYDVKLHAAINNAIAARKADLGQIGILDEWNALEQLSSQSAFVFYGHWLLVLVLIALDCLPVLAKLMGGSSAYDQLLAEQAASDKRVHAIDLQLREETGTADKEVEIYLIKLRKRERMLSEDRAERVRNAQGETDGLDDVRALAAKWMQES